MDIEALNDCLHWFSVRLTSLTHDVGHILESVINGLETTGQNAEPVEDLGFKKGNLGWELTEFLDSSKVSILR